MRSLASESRYGDRLGSLSDSFGKTLRLVHADRSGIVVGRTTTPLVNRGDALIHIAGLEPHAAPDRSSRPAAPDGDALPHDLEPDLS